MREVREGLEGQEKSWLTRLFRRDVERTLLGVLGVKVARMGLVP